ncbi:MAG: NUDIX domain-containing protein [Alphaproteobacteria bacterium]|nr:MAG: NUDIX domain-containing protein [Alphaproteobacteria bacterium]
MNPSEVFYDTEGQPRSWDGSPIRDRLGVYAICVSQGRVLLLWPAHAQTLAEFPGGSIKIGESEEHALRPAFRAATGMDLPPDALISCLRTTLSHYTDAYESGRFWNLRHVYCAADFSGEACALNQEAWRGNDGSTLRWVARADLPRVTFNFIHQKAAEFLMKGHDDE